MASSSSSPPAPFAHPLDDGTAVVVERSVEATAASLGAAGWRALSRARGAVRRARRRPDGRAARPLEPAASAPDGAASACTRSVRRRACRAAVSGTSARARCLPAPRRTAWSPLEFRGTAGFGLGLLVAAHAVGWPVARGGSQQRSPTRSRRICVPSAARSSPTRRSSRSRSCRRTRGAVRRHAAAVPPHRRRTASARGYRRRLERYRYGPGVFKMDWALDAPVPWRAERVRAVPARSTSAARSRRSRTPSAPRGKGVSTTGPYVLARSADRLRSVARAGREAHLVGRTATCRTDRPST